MNELVMRIMRCRRTNAVLVHDIEGAIRHISDSLTPA